MTKLVFFVLGTIAIAACSRSTPVVQSGHAATPVAAVKRDSNDREAFWSDTIRQWSTLSRGWNRIPGRFGTGCASDSTYAFKVRPGLTDKVMVFMNGGGMCWLSGNCDPKKPSAVMNSDAAANDVSVPTGILDHRNEKNPLRDWTMVFVNYCTADAHLGTSEVEYARRGGKGAAATFRIRHGGGANLEAVLDWVYVNIKRPGTFLVAGTDAGAIASPVVAARLARRFPRARVVQLGEGAGAYRSDSIPAIMALWGASDYLRQDPTYRSLDPSEFTFQRLYTAASRAHSRVRFAQLNTADDATQLAVLGSLGVKTTSIAKPLSANLSELRDQVSFFRSYTAPGKTHSLLRSNAIYTLKVDNTPFVEWLSGLVEGQPVEDVGEKLLVATPSKKAD